MPSERRRRRGERRRWKLILTVYAVLVAVGILGTVDWLMVSDATPDAKWAVGIAAAMVAGIMVHWGAMQLFFMREDSSSCEKTELHARRLSFMRVA